MKIKQEHFKYIEAKIGIFLTANSMLKKEYNERGLSAMRFRWDVLRFADLTNFLCDILYNYLDDNHIDTALRKIIDN